MKNHSYVRIEEEPEEQATKRVGQWQLYATYRTRVANTLYSGMRLEGEFLVNCIALLE